MIRNGIRYAAMMPEGQQLKVDTQRVATYSGDAFSYASEGEVMRRLRFPAAVLLVLAASPFTHLAAAVAVSLPDDDAPLKGWVRIVQARIIASAIKSHGFPRSARVMVQLTAHHDGSVTGVHTLSSSDPDPRFAKLAVRVVSLAGPFPPMPDSYRHERVRINVPLFFDTPSHVKHQKRR